MGLAGVGAASLHLLPGCESAAVLAFEHVYDALVVGLVKGNEDCFHFALDFSLARLSRRWWCFLRWRRMPLPANTQ